MANYYDDDDYEQKISRYQRNIERAEQELIGYQNGTIKTNGEKHRLKCIENTEKYIADMHKFKESAGRINAADHIVKNRNRAAIQVKIDDQIEMEHEREEAMLDRREEVLEKEIELERMRRAYAQENMNDMNDFLDRMKETFGDDGFDIDDMKDFFGEK